MRPCAKARPRFARGRTYMPADYVAWKEEFAMRAKEQYRGEVLTSPLVLTVTFATPTGKIRPDGDNAIGSIMDSLQPYPVANDRQFVALHMGIVKGPQEIRVTIEEAP